MTPVLPRNDRRQRRAGRSIPADDAGTLGCQAGALDDRIGLDLAIDISECGIERLEQILGIVFDVTLGRTVRADRYKGLRQDFTGRIEDDRAAGMTALVKTKKESALQGSAPAAGPPCA